MGCGDWQTACEVAARVGAAGVVWAPHAAGRPVAVACAAEYVPLRRLGCFAPMGRPRGPG